jgi:hypothetical protein
MGLKNEWTSSIKTTTQFPVVPGTAVTVKCSDSEALIKGSSEVTCSSGTDFSYSREPSCSKIGEYLMEHLQLSNRHRISNIALQTTVIGEMNRFMGLWTIAD